MTRGPRYARGVPTEPREPCGTAAAARRHRAWRQPVCGPCKAAERAYNNTVEARLSMVIEMRMRYLAVECLRGMIRP